LAFWLDFSGPFLLECSSCMSFSDGCFSLEWNFSGLFLPGSFFVNGLFWLCFARTPFLAGLF
jgi:hypothetical protein